MSDMTNILADPSEYGFEWLIEDVREGKGDKARVLGPGPIMRITDPMIFADHFPGRIEGMLDGSSCRVISQGKVRTQYQQWEKAMPNERGPKPTIDGLKPLVLGAVLGVRAKSRTVVTVEVKVYPLPDNTTTTDLNEFKSAYGIE